MDQEINSSNSDSNANTNTSNINTDINKDNTTAQNQVKVISLAIKDLAVLYLAYMPFISHGGLFIPTKKNFNMGDVLPLIITLMDDPNKYSVEGKVVWINPLNSQTRPPGIGVQFTGTNADELSKKIENLLIAQSKRNDATNTM